MKQKRNIKLPPSAAAKSASQSAAHLCDGEHASIFIHICRIHSKARENHWLTQNDVT